MAKTRRPEIAKPIDLDEALKQQKARAHRDKEQEDNNLEKKLRREAQENAAKFHNRQQQSQHVLPATPSNRSNNREDVKKLNSSEVDPGLNPFVRKKNRFLMRIRETILTLSTFLSENPRLKSFLAGTALLLAASAIILGTIASYGALPLIFGAGVAAGGGAAAWAWTCLAIGCAIASVSLSGMITGGVALAQSIYQKYFSHTACTMVYGGSAQCEENRPIAPQIQAPYQQINNLFPPVPFMMPKEIKNRTEAVRAVFENTAKSEEDFSDEPQNHFMNN